MVDSEILNIVYVGTIRGPPPPLPPPPPTHLQHPIPSLSLPHMDAMPGVTVAGSRLTWSPPSRAETLSLPLYFSLAKLKHTKGKKKVKGPERTTTLIRGEMYANEEGEEAPLRLERRKKDGSGLYVE